MTHSFVLLNDGSQVLLNDGSSKLLLNASGPTHGVETVGTHAVQKIYPKKRLREVSFVFWLKASIRHRIAVKFMVLESLLRPTVFSRKLPSIPVKELKKIIISVVKEEKTKLVKSLKEELAKAKAQLKLDEDEKLMKDPFYIAILLEKILWRLKK